MTMTVTGATLPIAQVIGHADIEPRALATKVTRYHTGL
jgi:hypothetical protein